MGCEGPFLLLGYGECIEKGRFRFNFQVVIVALSHCFCFSMCFWGAKLFFGDRMFSE